MMFGKSHGNDWIVSAFWTAVALFMVAQLVVITALGVTFKGARYALIDQPANQTAGGARTKTRLPPRRLSPKKPYLQGAYTSRPPGKSNSSVPSCNQTKNSSEPTKDRQKFRLLSNPTSWPPVENRLYPDMQLYNQDGKLTRLSDLSGNVIIVQPVAMSCPMSQAFSGANQEGKSAFKLCFPTIGVKEFGERMYEYTGIHAKTPELVFVQLLLYNMSNEAPTVDDAKAWARHFDLRTSQNRYVLVATPEMVSKKSNILIPGFQLIDRSFILRSDSTGLLPKRSLYNHFFPELQRLLARDSFRVKMD